MPVSPPEYVDTALPAAVSDMVAALSPLGRHELMAVLRAELAPAPSATDRILAELGALAELLRTHPGARVRTEVRRGRIEPSATPADDMVVLASLPRRSWRVIDRQQYDRLRPDSAPTSELLQARYGTWSKACRAADGLLPDGRYTGVGKPWVSVNRGRPKAPRYTREEMLAGIRECAFALLRRPSSAAYISWSRARRAHLRRGSTEHPRLAGWEAIRAQFGGYPQALAAARITDEELAAARARRQLPGDRSGGATPADRLRALDSDTVTGLGLSAAEIEQLTSSGFAGLTLSQAAAIGAALNGSLDWLAARAPDPGHATPAAVALDADRLREQRDLRGISDTDLRRSLGVGVGPWRRLFTARDEPLLGWVAHLAGVLDVPIDALLAPRA